jgi:hypothetical protein
LRRSCIPLFEPPPQGRWIKEATRCADRSTAAALSRSAGPDCVWHAHGRVASAITRQLDALLATRRRSWRAPHHANAKTCDAGIAPGVASLSAAQLRVWGLRGGFQGGSVSLTKGFAKCMAKAARVQTCIRDQLAVTGRPPTG